MSSLTEFPGAALTEFPRRWASGEFYLVACFVVEPARPGRLLGR